MEIVHYLLVAPYGIVHATEGDEVVGRATQGFTHHFHLIFHLIDASPHHVYTMTDEMNIGATEFLDEGSDVALGVYMHEKFRHLGQTFNQASQMWRIGMCGDEEREFHWRLSFDLIKTIHSLRILTCRIFIIAKYMDADSTMRTASSSGWFDMDAVTSEQMVITMKEMRAKGVTSMMRCHRR